MNAEHVVITQSINYSSMPVMGTADTDITELYNIL